eukprot:1565403-Pyramimonas_sp.AAC.2
MGVGHLARRPPFSKHIAEDTAASKRTPTLDQESSPATSAVRKGVVKIRDRRRLWRRGVGSSGDFIPPPSHGGDPCPLVVCLLVRCVWVFVAIAKASPPPARPKAQ